MWYTKLETPGPYVVWKRKKEFTRDLKETIYNAPTKEAAEMELVTVEQNGGKYPYAIRSGERENNWEE